jgi:hypothetical protein
MENFKEIVNSGIGNRIVAKQFCHFVKKEVKRKKQIIHILKIIWQFFLNCIIFTEAFGNSAPDSDRK